MIFVMLTWATSQVDPLETEIAEVVRRLGTYDATNRDVASRDLEAFTRKARWKAVKYLTPFADSPDAEIRARIRDQLSLLAEADHCRRSLEVFDLLNLPDCTGKPFAIYNPNWIGRNGQTEVHFQYLVGWIVSESRGEIAVARPNLVTESYRRDRSLPADWDHIKSSIPPDLPLPGEYKVIDPQEFCRNLSFIGTTTYVVYKNSGVTISELGLALYAYIALQQGEYRLALKVAELSRIAIRAYRNKYLTTPFSDALRELVAENMRSQAIRDANRGQSRDKLLEKWEIVEKIAPRMRQGEPREMIRLYKQLLAEDSAWKEPSPVEWALMSGRARAEVWIGA